MAGRTLGAVEEFLASVAVTPTANGWSGPERRGSPRQRYLDAVHIMPVDPHGRRPDRSERLRALASNLSACGIALLVGREIDWPHMAVELTPSQGTSLLVVAEVTRVRAIRHRTYEVAGRFLELLE